MKSPFPAELAAFLREFVASHQGLRLGPAFGRPAAFAGRRMFAVVRGDTLCCRLPPDIARREVEGRRARPLEPPVGGNRGSTREWVAYRPADHLAMTRLAPTLEVAARHAAEGGRLRSYLR
jgi:hypothetical protein